jgi:hypothetical protein
MRYLMILAIMGWIGMVHSQENISLILPYDGDTIETKNPLLTWSFLGGMNQNDNRVFYRLILVELKDEQSAEAGITVNQPLLKMDRVKGTQLFYPYDAPALKEGKRYGWQIHKISNNIIVDKSEAFEFIIPLPKEPSAQYYKLKVKHDGAAYLAEGGKFYFELVETYQDKNLSYFLYDSSNKLISSSVQQDKEAEGDFTTEIKHSGSNYYVVDLGAAAKPGIYKIVVQDAKKQKFEAKFEVK